MEIFNIKEFIPRAKEALAGKEVRRLALIHAGVTVAVGLVATLLQYVLAEGIGNTSGLSGLTTRSVLETVQTALQWANMILLPFWNLGFLYVALQWARGNDPVGKDLLTGFHCVGPCLGLLLNRTLLTLVVVVLVTNISSMVYMMLPASVQVQELMMEFANTEALYDYLFTLDTAQITELLRAMAPMLVISVALSWAILIPMLYRFRLAEFAVLNYPGVRGLAAMVISATLLRRRRWQLFKLDLQLWWYYGLKLLCTLVLYADVLLGTLGVTPPAGDLSFLITYLLYLAGFFLVEAFFRPQVDTTYAVFYEHLVELQQKQVPADPRNVPGDPQE